MTEIKTTPSTPPAAPPPPDDTRIKLAEAETARKMLEAENQRLQGLVAGAQRGFVAPPPPQAPPPPDPLEELSAQDLTLPPDRRRKLMNDAINLRVDARVNAVAEELERRRLIDRGMAENNATLTALAAAHPEIIADQEGFAGAVGQANFRAQQQRLELSGADKLRLAMQIYQERKAPQPPVLEGAGLPPGGGSVAPPAPPKPRSWFEKKYGARKTDELHEEEPDFEKMTKEYTFKKNKALAALDVRSDIGAVLDQYETERTPEDPSLLRQEL